MRTCESIYGCCSVIRQSDGKEVELIIKSFQFVPPGSPQPAWLSDLSAPPDGPVQFAIHTASRTRRYLIQMSTNLLAWQDLATVLATNNFVLLQDNNPAVFGQRFYRAMTQP